MNKKSQKTLTLFGLIFLVIVVLITSFFLVIKRRLFESGTKTETLINDNSKSVSSTEDFVLFEKELFNYSIEHPANLVLHELGSGKEVKPVLIHEIQRGPVEDEILHVDLLQVDLKKKVTAEVPVELVGSSPAEKQGLGTVVQYINEVRVETFPTDIPSKFEIDTSLLSEVDQSVMIKDIKIDQNKIKIVDDLESIVVKVEPPKEEKEEAVVAPEAESQQSVAGEDIETKEPDSDVQKDTSNQTPAKE